jgi:hypothetical protein
MAIYGGKVEVEEIATCDQYTIQGDAFFSGHSRKHQRCRCHWRTLWEI